MKNRMVSFDNINELKGDSYIGLDVSKENDQTSYVILSESLNESSENSKQNNSESNDE